jgi:hypothetical protein
VPIVSIPPQRIHDWDSLLRRVPWIFRFPHGLRGMNGWIDYMSSADSVEHAVMDPTLIASPGDALPFKLTLAGVARHAGAHQSAPLARCWPRWTFIDRAIN